MLQSKLTQFLACMAGIGLLAACTGDGGAIRDNVIEPGITALNESKALACNGDAETIGVAMQAYELLESKPAADEATLVASQFLREESELWNISNGQLVAEHPDCGVVTPVAIVTEQSDTSTADFSTELAAMTPESVVAGATEAQIAEVGGRDCALEVAAVSIAFGHWAIAHDAEPTSIRQLLDEGSLQPLALWKPSGMILEPSSGSHCLGPIDLLAI